MSAPRRVLVLTVSTLNPFIEAWVAAIEASGAIVATVVDGRRTGEREVPSVLPNAVLLTDAGPADWARRAETLLGGPPEVVFDWWGMGALSRRLVVDEWPRVPRVLCVDTFPNASRIRAEARDYAQANAWLGRARGLAVASEAMRRAVDVSTGGRFRSMPSATVYSPFPLRSHHHGPDGERRPGPLRFCFTGRSDYLFATDAGMAKDAVGAYLVGFLERGAEVHVQQPEGARAAAELTARGFRFYPDTPRDRIIDGGLADVISGFDGHLVVYAQPTGVVRRRIANSLSTRFATAVCAPTPVIAPRAAVFVDELFERHRIGFRADDIDEIVERVRLEGQRMRATWYAEHEQWAGEAYAGVLSQLWERVVSR